MDIDNRRQLDIDTAKWHLHIRYHDTNWLGQTPVPRDELIECDSAEALSKLAESAKTNAVANGVHLMLTEDLAPGEMPWLHRPQAWYLHAHFLTHDGTILQNNAVRQLLDPHDNEEEARAAMKALQRFMLGQGGQMLYLAIVPPIEHATIVIAPRQ